MIENIFTWPSSKLEMNPPPSLEKKNPMYLIFCFWDIKKIEVNYKPVKERENIFELLKLFFR